jgi:hypothetical protein
VSIGGFVPISTRTRLGPADAGMATAELAVTLPALALLVVLSLYAVGAVTAQLRCVDAAGVAARLAGRGEGAALVEREAMLAAPGDASVRVTRAGGMVTARVAAIVDIPVLGGLLPGIRVHAAATELDDAADGSGGRR